MNKDVIIDLINLLDGRMQLADIEAMDDATLKAVSELLLNWHELVSSERDKRALRKKSE
jgi:hypothetical protein